MLHLCQNLSISPLPFGFASQQQAAFEDYYDSGFTAVATLDCPELASQLIAFKAAAEHHLDVAMVLATTIVTTKYPAPAGSGESDVVYYPNIGLLVLHQATKLTHAHVLETARLLARYLELPSSTSAIATVLHARLLDPEASYLTQLLKAPLDRQSCHGWR